MSKVYEVKNMNSHALAEVVAAEGLRASHQIISTLEKCKSSSEYILDELPDLLVIMTPDGRILKGNFAASKLLGVEPEDILNRNLFEVFHSETANIMKSRISSLLNDRSIGQKQFELPIIDKSSRRVEHLWTVSIFSQISERRGPLIRILGKDISKIKDFEKKLSQIFSAIPLGIFTVNSDGKIESPYSLFTNYLLGQNRIENMFLDDALFKPIWDTLDSNEKAGASQVVDCIGGDTLWFEMAKLHFPREVKLTRGTPDGVKTCWLGITYHPIVNDNKIQKLMIVLEDRTEVVESRRELELQREVENSKIKKIIEVQRCSESLIEVVLSDFDHLFPRLVKEMENNEPEKIARTLHGVKGVARTAGFSTLEHDTHECEDKLLSNLKDGNVDSHWLVGSIRSLEKEWHELRSLCLVLTGYQDSHHQLIQADQVKIVQELDNLRAGLDDEGQRQTDRIIKMLRGRKSSDIVELSTLNPKLEKQLAITAASLDKKVNLKFEWNDVQVNRNQSFTLSEIFLHLLNNSIDHGIEAPLDRKKVGKNEAGTIFFHAEMVGNHIHIEISDNGRGIDKDIILKIAIEKGIISEQQARKFKADGDILELMLAPGFSTKKEATTISGRGIGLDSVDSAVKTLGCKKLYIKSEINKGTTFAFDVPVEPNES